MPDLSFPQRLLILIAVLAVVAALDRWLKGKEATRWREYLFLLCAATAGGLFAAGVDQVSLALSPEYFVVGKGIEPDADLRWNVTGLGFHAGFLAGAVCGGALLLVNQPKPDRPALPAARMAVAASYVPVYALLGAPVGVLFWMLAGPSLGPDLEGLMTDGEARLFLLVQGLHMGLYGGALVGALLAVRWVRRERPKAVSETDLAVGHPGPGGSPVSEPTPQPAQSDPPESGP